MTVDNKEPVRVRYVCVNRIPNSCGECPMLIINYGYNGFDYFCGVVDPLKNHIVGNPNDMTYRRSDCPLLVTES